MKVPKPTTEAKQDERSYPQAEVERARSRETWREFLTEPYLSVEEDGAYLCATDSYILVRIPVEADGEPAGPVPAAALKTARQWHAPEVKLEKTTVTVEDPIGLRKLQLARPGVDHFPETRSYIPADRSSMVVIGLNVERLYQAAKAIGARVVKLSVPTSVDRRRPMPLILEPLSSPDGRLALIMPFALGSQTS